VLRAAAFQAGSRLGGVDTATYIFPKEVRRQSGEGFPKTWGTNEGKAVPAHYALAPEIVNDPAYSESLSAALQAIPTFSIVMDPQDLFDPAQGIYAHSREKGGQTERAASVELIYADGRKGFQANCGIRIQGGWNRRPEESPKHSFRLLFKQEYGPARLRFPLFGDGLRELDTLTLRAGCNNTWLHWSGEERRRGDFIRDQWMRDTLRAMGHPSARGLFAHLYLNGLYWGLYNPTERPNASFAAAYFGGSAKDYDAMNGEKILQGDKSAWNRLMALANAGLAGAPEYAAVQGLLDVSNLIDFMLANLYGANSDWDHVSNWYAARRRNPPGQFRFFIWDGERTLEGVEANTIGFDDDQSPPRLFQKLRANAEFRLQFADHVQRHFFSGGALAPEASAGRFRKWSKEIDLPLIAESARWGSYRRDVHRYKTGPYELYSRNEHWRPEISRLLDDYFPKRTAVVLQQFREAGLFPQIDAPRAAPATTGLALNAARGVIYFTQDGSDPRLPGGKVSPSAAKYLNALTRSSEPKIKARALAGPPESGEWSALAEY